MLNARGEAKGFFIAIGTAIIVVLVLFTFLKGGPFGISGFLIFQQISQSDFDSGTYNNTNYNAGGYVQLSSGASQGTYISKVFDGSTQVVWNNISWGEGLPYQE
ncbi:TPA: hypothetical protein H1016_01235, partial [archaeon]|nr:hypothetical protein [Candidatus Naiadarchaeum limnaeum]